jgi:methylglutaconyl-CoA hydratase
MPATVKAHQTGSLLTLTIDRPQKRNALNQETVLDLTAALESARNDDSIRVIVLTGEGKVFSAGADLESLQALRSASKADNEFDSRAIASLFRTICTHPCIIVARVNGHAIAGGCGLVAAADFSVASDSAKLGFTEVRIGFVPAIVSTLLVRKLRGSDVRRLLLSGELIAAPDAARIGLVNQCVPPDELDSAVDDLVGMLSRETSAMAVSLTKELLAAVTDLPFEDAIEYATAMNVRARETADCRAGIDAFLAKVPPPWKVDGDES